MTEFTQAAILKAANEVKGYIEKYNALPVGITVAGVLVNRADFLRMMVVVTRWLNTNNFSEAYDYIPGVYKNAPNPTESLKAGNIQRTEYVGAPGTDPSESIAKRISNFMDGAVAPNYSNSSLGTISFYNLIYMFSRILAWYQKTGYLPAYSAVTAKTYTDNIVSSYPAEYKQYLVATTNCQVDNAVIVNITNTLNGGKAIFTYVRDEIEYDYYYNTLRGAVRTAQEKIANCCDDAHLNVALARAKGLPARYVHSTAVAFDTITCGHVWAEIYENGKWNKADGSNNNNEYGVNPVDSRIPATAIVTRYATLPF